MLFAVECPYCHNRVWVDVAFGCERKFYASSLLDLEEYILKNANVREIYKDEEMAFEIKKNTCWIA